MPTIKATVSCPIRDSFRVQQVAGIFGLRLEGPLVERFKVDVPGRGENWQIGLIVGPSGSDKSTVAGKAFGAGIYGGASWPNNRAVVDCFDDLSIRQVVELFTAVGLGSQPSWLKPYHVLSQGERFRCELARALGRGLEGRGERQEPESASGSRVVVFDEFTSVVDRTVAKVCSAAIAKGIRRGRIPCRFVGVTCHHDVIDWLEPDWVVSMETSELIRRTPGQAGGCFRRPPIKLAIHRCEVAAWELFKRHHYLSGELPRGARCYLATWEGVPVSFCATVGVLAKKNHRRFARIVTLPDYQGIGIGMRVVAAVAALHRAEGHRVSLTASHPGVVRHCERSPAWRLVGVRKWDHPRRSKLFPSYQATGRTVVSFEYG